MALVVVVVVVNCWLALGTFNELSTSLVCFVPKSNFCFVLGVVVSDFI